MVYSLYKIFESRRLQVRNIDDIYVSICSGLVLSIRLRHTPKEHGFEDRTAHGEEESVSLDQLG